MKKIDTLKGLKIIALAAAVCLLMTVLSLLLSGRAFVLTGAFNTLLNPGRSLMDTLAGWAEEQFAEADKVQRLEQENIELKRRIAEMEEMARDSQTVLDENSRLRELVDFAERNRDFVFEPVTLVAWGSSNWSSEFTISKGSESGIEPYDCVVTETGALVGRVNEVGIGWSTVRTVIDTDFSMGVLIYNTSETAVAEGELSLMKQGYLRLTYIPADSELRTGDLILTAGLGGTYPKGLTIGTVAIVELDVSGLTNYAVIKPSADIYSISAIYVIKDFDITE